MAADYSGVEAFFRKSILPRNEAFAASHEPQIKWKDFPKRPAVAVGTSLLSLAYRRARANATIFSVTCMDPRCIPEKFLDLGEMELGVIRTAGGRIPDALRSLYTIVGLGGGGTTAMGLVVVVHHTDCGLISFSQEHFNSQLKKYSAPGAEDEIDKIDFLTFHDYDQSVREDVAMLKADPILPRGLVVLGFVYDIESGLLREVK